MARKKTVAPVTRAQEVAAMPTRLWLPLNQKLSRRSLLLNRVRPFGKRAEAEAWLKAYPDVRVIYLMVEEGVADVVERHGDEFLWATDELDNHYPRPFFS